MLTRIIANVLPKLMRGIIRLLLQHSIPTRGTNGKIIFPPIDTDKRHWQFDLNVGTGPGVSSNSDRKSWTEVFMKRSMAFGRS